MKNLNRSKFTISLFVILSIILSTMGTFASTSETDNADKLKEMEVAKNKYEEVKKRI